VAAVTKSGRHQRRPSARLLPPAQQFMGQFLGTLSEFPPRQKTSSFGIDQTLKN
jgi:hypothetical protein